MPYRTAHILIGGFTQRVGRDGNGIYSLFDRIYRNFAGESTLVQYHGWYVNPRDIANELNDLIVESLANPIDERCRIQLIGYSFGGQTVANVCRELAAINESSIVDGVTLCDPVSRGGCGRLGWHRAMMPCLFDIHIPGNVSKVVWLRQNNPRWRCKPPFFYPASHDVRTTGSTTLHGAYNRDRVEHVDMDNDPVFERLAIEQAAELHGVKPGDVS